MKRIALYIFSLIALCGCLFVLPHTQVKAEEIEQPETTETTETTEAQENEISADEKELIKKFIMEIGEKYLGEYLDKQTLSLIASLVVMALGYIGVFSINLAYAKYKKGGVTEFMKALTENDGAHLTKFVETIKQQNEELKKEIKVLKDGYETMMKIFVLSQDKTADGKVAMLEYLGNHTENKEIQNQVKQEVKEIQEQEQLKAEVNEKVEKDYEKIF